MWPHHPAPDAPDKFSRKRRHTRTYTCNVLCRCHVNQSLVYKVRFFSGQSLWFALNQRADPSAIGHHRACGEFSAEGVESTVISQVCRPWGCSPAWPLFLGCICDMVTSGTHDGQGEVVMWSATKMHGHCWGSRWQSTCTAEPSRERRRKPTDRQGQVDILGTTKGSAGPVEPGVGGRMGEGAGSAAAARERTLPTAGHTCSLGTYCF